MKQFRLNRPPGKQRTELPHIRISQPYYQLVYRLRQETGLPMGNIIEQCVSYALRSGGDWEQSMGNIIEQCISYALRSGGDWEQSMLDQYIKPSAPTGCPLLEQEEIPEDEEGGTA